MLLLKGDCLVEMDKIPDGSVDLILTDPPYGTTACKWDSVIPFEPMWKQLNRIIKANGAIVMTVSQPFTSVLICSNLKMFKYEWIWDKIMGTNFTSAKTMPMKRHENICVFANGKTIYNPQKLIPKKKDSLRKSKLAKKKIEGSSDKWQINFNPEKQFRNKDIYKFPESILLYRGVSGNNQYCKTNQLHPTQKPVALMEYLIKTYTNENETVLDFTMGSGTTGVACVNTNRKFIGIEMDDNYFEIAKKRIEDAKNERVLC